MKTKPTKPSGWLNTPNLLYLATALVVLELILVAFWGAECLKGCPPRWLAGVALVALCALVPSIVLYEHAKDTARGEGDTDNNNEQTNE